MHPATLTLIITGAFGLVIALLKVIIPRFIEQNLQQRHAKELEDHKNKLNLIVEEKKTDLAVWFELRKDILLEKWEHHKLIINEMTGVILSFQAMLYDRQPLATTRKSVELFRVLVHRSYALVPVEGIMICDDFYQSAYRFLDRAGNQEEETENAEQKLKELRNTFREFTHLQFGLAQMPEHRKKEAGISMGQ